MMPGSQPIRLYKPAELAELFGISERQLMDWRRQYGWPSVRVGRTIRFTQPQVDEILAAHSQAASTSGGAEPAAAIAGQSKASAARARRAS